MDIFNTAYSIWLPSLKERNIHINNLELALQKQIFRYEAYDGKNYIFSFKNHTHILPGEIVTPGIIGCLLSHISILKTIKENKYVIFEDDCEFVGDLKELDIFLNTVPKFDILCLGATEYVEYSKTENKNLVSIQRFWGTHALCITNTAAKAILKTYETYNNKNILLPADWLYSYAIKTHNLVAYGPSNPKQFFKQVSGLISSINGKIRV